MIYFLFAYVTLLTALMLYFISNIRQEISMIIRVIEKQNSAMNNLNELVIVHNSAMNNLNELVIVHTNVLKDTVLKS